MSKSLTKNSIYYLIYNVLNLGFPLFTSIYVARILLPNEIGNVAYAQNIAQYFVILSFLGIPTYGMREIAKHRGNKKEISKIFTELFIINFISTIFFMTIYLFVIVLNRKLYQNFILYFIVGLSIFLNMLNISWLYEGLEEFRFISIRNLIFKILCFILLIVTVRNRGDYLQYALVTVFGTAGNYIINMIYMPKYAAFCFKNIDLKRHMKPIIYLVSVNLAIEIYSLVDVTMIGFFCKSTNVAYYTYASKIQKMLLQVINSFTMVVVPRLSFYYKKKDFSNFNNVIFKTLKIILILSIPMIFGIILVGNSVIEILYGSAFMQSALVLKILSVLLVISPIGYLLGSRVMLVTGNEKNMLITVSVGAIVNVICNYFLIMYFDEVGAAFASVLSELIVMVIYINFGKKYFKIGSIKNSCFKILCSTVAMTFLIIIIENNIGRNVLSLVISIVLGALIYFLSLIVLKEETILDYVHVLLKKIKMYN